MVARNNPIWTKSKTGKSTRLAEEVIRKLLVGEQRASVFNVNWNAIKSWMKI